MAFIRVIAKDDDVKIVGQGPLERGKEIAEEVCKALQAWRDCQADPPRQDDD